MTETRVSLPEGAEVSAKSYLTRNCGISGGLWKRIKRSGTFCKNGAPAVAARTTVRSGDVLSYALPVVPSFAAERLPLDIRYEDDDLLVLNKPAGMLVHPTTKERCGTVANGVLGLYAARGDTLDFHPCHRLDRNTTGLLLIAKRPEVQYYFTKHRGAVRREYLALAEGTLSPPAGTIHAPIARALPKHHPAPRLARGKARAHTLCDGGGGRRAFSAAPLSKRDVRTRSACTSRISVILCSATISTAGPRTKSHAKLCIRRASCCAVRARGKR